MKVIAIIPARGGSKRMLNKNIKLLGDKPLLAHSITYAKEHSDLIDEVYVSTDDIGIKEVAIAFGAKVIDRPKEISGDYATTVSALKHAIQTIDETVDLVVLLQATNPIRSSDLLVDCLAIMKDKGCDSLFTVSRNHDKLGKVVDGAFVPYNYSFGQRSQDMESLYYENGSLYISKVDLILNDVITSKNAYPFEVEQTHMNVDIDTQEDFDYAEYIYNKQLK